MKVRLYHITELVSWALLAAAAYVVWVTPAPYWFPASLPWAVASIGMMVLTRALRRYHRKLSEWLGGGLLA
jgi:hypothetical protein